MRKYILISVLCLLFTETLFSQERVKQVSLNPNYSLEKVKTFDYISPQMDLTESLKIADYLLSIEKEGRDWLQPIFYRLWEEAKGLGANGFTIGKVNLVDGNYVTSVELYFLTEDQMDENFSFYDHNKVYILGDMNTNKLDKTKKLKVGKEKVKVAPYEFLEFQNEVDKELKLSIGGVLGGMSLYIKGEEGRAPSFYSLGGFSAAPSMSVGPSRGVAIQFSTGSILPVPLNMGLFVITILTKVD